MVFADSRIFFTDRNRIGLLQNDAWQKRHRPGQPRIISMLTLSWMACANGTMGFSGIGAFSKSSTTAVVNCVGRSGSSGLSDIILSPAYLNSYSEGT